MVDCLPPSVVILMATYNPNINFFEKQIQSLIQQDFKDWMCIVSDDGSLELIFNDMVKLIGSDNRFKLVQSTESEKSVNKNFENCVLNAPKNAKYYCFCDQDDEWMAEKLSTLVSWMDGHPEFSMCHSDATVIDESGKIINKSLWDLENRKVNFSDCWDLLIRNNASGCLSIYRAKPFLSSIPFYSESSDCFHDHWVNLNCAVAGPIGRIHSPLVRYRQHGQNVVGPKSLFELFFSNILLYPQFIKAGNVLRMYKALNNHLNIGGGMVLTSNLILPLKDIFILKVKLYFGKDFVRLIKLFIIYIVNMF